MTRVVIEIPEKYLSSNIIDITVFTGENNTITDVTVEDTYVKFQVLPIDDMKTEQKVIDCRKCQWIWLSEKGDKYDEEGGIFCDNGGSHNCGRHLGTIDDYSDVIDVGCDNWEEPI